MIRYPRPSPTHWYCWAQE